MSPLTLFFAITAGIAVGLPLAVAVFVVMLVIAFEIWDEYSSPRPKPLGVRHRESPLQANETHPWESFSDVQSAARRRADPK